jgi:hypothetical protein
LRARWLGTRRRPVVGCWLCQGQAACEEDGERVMTALERSRHPHRASRAEGGAVASDRLSAIIRRSRNAAPCERWRVSTADRPGQSAPGPGSTRRRSRGWDSPISGIAVSSTVRPSGGIGERACFPRLRESAEVLIGHPSFVPRPPPGEGSMCLPRFEGHSKTSPSRRW